MNTVRISITAAALALAMQTSSAESVYHPDTSIAAVAVNGGNDSANIGTTCITVTTPVFPACTGGYIAIQNNNKQLLTTALLAKTTNSRIRLYYSDNAGSFHCPGNAFTPCSVINIDLK